MTDQMREALEAVKAAILNGCDTIDAVSKIDAALTASAPKGEIWGWYEPIVPELGGSLVERYRKGSEKPLGWSKHAVPLYTSSKSEGGE